jgi:fucose permease
MVHTDRRSILALACLMILSLGIMTASLGPLLPEIAANNGVSVTTIGSLLTVLFLGALAAQIVGGPVIDRLGEMPVLLVSTLLLALGTFGIGAGRWLPLTLGMSFLAGVGHGAVDLCASVLISRLYPERSASALSLTSLFFGIGAFAGPALAGLFLARSGSGLAALWITTALLLVQALVIYLLRGAAPKQAPHSQTAESGPLYGSLLLWMLGLMILLYVGAETIVGSWITAYISDTTSLSYDTATLAASAYWLALTLGRLTNSVLTLRLPARLTLGLTLAGSLLSGVLLALSQGSSALSIGAVVGAGFFFGAIYPSVISITSTIFAHSPGRAVSLVAALGSIGGMFLPWLHGWLLNQVSPAAYTIGLCVVIGAMLAAYLYVELATGRKTVPLAPAAGSRR